MNLKWGLVIGGILGVCIIGVCVIAVVGVIVMSGRTTDGQVIGTAQQSKDDAQYIDVRQLAADPKAYVGQNVYLQGLVVKVTQRDKYTWVQLAAKVRDEMWAGESVVFEMTPKNANIFVEECYRMYGVVKGTQKVTFDLTGQTTEKPYLQGYDLEQTPQTLTSCEGP